MLHGWKYSPLATQAKVATGFNYLTGLILIGDYQFNAGMILYYVVCVVKIASASPNLAQLRVLSKLKLLLNHLNLTLL
jgi:hypothetical protein